MAFLLMLIGAILLIASYPRLGLPRWEIAAIIGGALFGTGFAIWIFG